MPRPSPQLLLRLSLALISSGCGTLVNVTAPTTPTLCRAFGPTGCEPFGGVQRSVMVGSMPLMAGPIGVLPAVLAVGVDAPLSLVGDVATLPIVYYRLRPRPPEDRATPSNPGDSALQMPTPKHSSEP